MRIAATLLALTMAVPTATASDATALGIGFICGAENGPPRAQSRSLVILPGMGTGGFPVDSRDGQAQAWFDYGIQLYHAFYHDEAKQALARAAQIDPTCALCAWGEALSLGPTLNYDVSPAEKATALIAADRAARLVRPTDARGQALIGALQARYAPGTAKSEPAYGQAMDAIAQRFPNDNEIASLAAHALMTPARSNNLSGLPRANALLEGVLARSPNDTAAIHYYIHGTEFAGVAGRALPYAERLSDLAPDASHLVHMAAHTLMRLGRYEDVGVVNARALKADADYQAAMGYQGPLSDQRYYLHNYMFGLAGAMMAGDSALALKYADHAAIAFPKTAFPGRRDNAAARSLIAYGRYAPARALALAEPGADQLNIRIYRHYARGEAYAALGNATGVLTESRAIEALTPPAGDASNGFVIAISRRVLEGRAAMLTGDYDRASRRFSEAAIIQEQAYGAAFDPPPWWYPVRRSAAAAHLKAGRYAVAAREARKSLDAWPRDAMALRVLGEAEAKLGQGKASRDHLAAARAAWQGDLRKTTLNTI